MTAEAVRNQTYVDGTRERIVEPLNKLDTAHTISPTPTSIRRSYSRRALTAATRADERDVRAGLDGEVEVAEDTNAGARGIAEVDVLEADAALDVLGGVALRGLGVDLGHRVEELDHIGRRRFGRGDIGDEGEHIARLDGREGRRLKIDKSL